MVEKYVPQRGDIVALNFNPQAGREQSGRRPALVVSPDSYNKKVGLALFCPVTGNIKGYPFEVNLPEKLKTKGVVLSDHVKSLDWRVRGAEFIEKLPSAQFDEVMLKLQTLILV